MKKFLTLGVVAMLVSGAAFAGGDKEKDKKDCPKECSKDNKSCHKEKKAKTTSTDDKKG